MLDAAAAGESVLLIAPTGRGETLAGFLPSLITLAANPRSGHHTLYVSPPKAPATDIARNLVQPGYDLQLFAALHTRFGDSLADCRCC